MRRSPNKGSRRILELRLERDGTGQGVRQAGRPLHPDHFQVALARRSGHPGTERHHLFPVGAAGPEGQENF